MNQQQKTDLVAIARTIANDDKVADTMASLYSRWMDEKDYEDVADYGKVLEPIVNGFAGAKFIQMTRRPFGFHFKATIADGTAYVFALCLTTKEYYFKGIAAA